MLDYISWYLVELERRLRRKRSARATTDLLIETRAHLEEHAGEMIAKGMDKVNAERMAVADFGDPQSVANAVLGHGHMSRSTYWALATCIALAGLGMVFIPVLGFMSPQISPVPIMTAATLPWIGALALIWIGFRHSRWIAFGAAGILVAVSALASLWTTSQIELATLRSESIIVYVPRNASEIQQRKDWLNQAQSEFGQLQKWRASRNTPAGEEVLKGLIQYRGGYLAPVGGYSSSVLTRVSKGGPTFGGGGRFLIQPGREPLGLYLNTYGSGFFMNHYDRYKEAREVWRDNGDGFAVYLKRQISAVEEETAALSSISPTPWGQRWNLLGKWQVTFGVILSGIFVGVNGVAMFLGSFYRQTRRNRWRRQIS
ncbi:MAG: permease prefix domain 1-containing protein [Fimbriimonadaceae bacterium]